MGCQKGSYEIWKQSDGEKGFYRVGRQKEKTADHAKIVEDYDPDIFVGNEMEVVSVDVCGNKDLGFLPGR